MSSKKMPYMVEGIGPPTLVVFTSNVGVCAAKLAAAIIVAQIEKILFIS
jgi:hypothetical protein